MCTHGLDASPRLPAVRLGVRELRSNLAALLRRAEAGQRIVITVGGRPVAGPAPRRCLDRATDLGRSHPIRTIDALHLAAADRLPRPVTYATFDSRQIPVALALGFTVVST